MTELSRLTCDELTRFVNGVTSTALEAELLSRLEDTEVDEGLEALEALEALENVEMSIGDFTRLTEAMPGDTDTTVELLKALNDAGISCAGDFIYLQDEMTDLTNEKELEQMALEEALKENTDAMHSLTEMLSRLSAQAIGEKLIASTKENLQAQAPKSAKATPSTGTAKTPEASVAPSDSGASASLSYDNDVKPKALALVGKKGVTALQGVLAEFGVDHATKLKPEQYADVVKAFDDAVAA